MTTSNNEEIAIVANAIGWTFFGEKSEDGTTVEIEERDSEKCVKAAKRALEHLEILRYDDDTEDDDDAEEHKDSNL